jgi:transcription elongation factor GreA
MAVSINMPLTRAAYSKLQSELEQLRSERAAPEEEAIAAARKARLEEILSRAEVVDEAAEADVVSIGSAVTVLDQESGRTETYIVDGAHGSMDSNVITAVSPMGVALIGRERGEVVDVALPSGRSRTLTILDVAVAHDP